MELGLIIGALIATIFFIVGYVVRSMKDVKDELENLYITAPVESEKDKKDIADIFRHKDGKKKGLLSYTNFIRE